MNKKLNVWRKSLEKAIIEEDTTFLDKTLKTISTVKNDRIAGGLSLLQFAIEKSSERMIKYFMNRGFRFENSMPIGETLLHMVARHCNHHVVDYLLNHGFLINEKDALGRTPLHVAVESYGKRCLSEPSTSNDPAIIYHLLDCSADVNASTFAGETPLLQAAKQGSENLVRTFLKYGADINHSDENSYNALHHAADKNHWKIVEILLDAGADVDSVTNKGRTALHLAASRAMCETTVKLLIKRGATVNAKDLKGATPIFLAASISLDILIKINTNNDIKQTTISINRRQHVIRSLLDAGADVNHPNNAGESAFHRVLSTGVDSLIELFLERDADVFFRNAEDQSALHLAIESASEKIVKVIIDRGVPLDDKTWNGATPLHISVQFRKLKHIKLLLAMGADINATDFDGYTPLHYAARLHYLPECEMNEILKILLDNNADFFVKLDDEESPLEYAVKKSNNTMAKYMLRFLAVLTVWYVSEDSKRDIKRLVGMVSGDGRLSFYQKHLHEIVTMKSLNIYKQVSYFNILTQSMNWIGSITRNAQLVKAFNACQVTKKFPLYGNIIEKKFQVAVEKMNLIDEAIEYLSELLSEFNLPIPILEKILKYFKIEDLEQFLKSCQEND